jgi:hypothetical protein
MRPRTTRRRTRSKMERMTTKTATMRRWKM